IQALGERFDELDVDTPGGPGNPFGRQVARNRQLMLAYFSEKKLLAIFGKLESMSMAGNVSAHRLLLAYAVGKPAAVANPDRGNQEEWELRKEQPHLEEAAMRMQSQMPHAPVLRTQRVMDTAKEEAYVNQMRKEAEKIKAGAMKQQAREERRARRKEERR